MASLRLLPARPQCEAFQPLKQKKAHENVALGRVRLQHTSSKSTKGEMYSKINNFRVVTAHLADHVIDIIWRCYVKTPGINSVFRFANLYCLHEYIYTIFTKFLVERY